MKKNLNLTIFVCLALSAASSKATNLFWDADGSGAGTCGASGPWDTTSLFWGTVACGGTYSTWPNTTADTATFTGTASYTMTPAVNISLNKFTNSCTAGTVTVVPGVGTQITFGGTAPALHLDAKTAFTVPLKGAVTLTKTGAGQMQLNNNAQTIAKYIIKAGIITTANTNKWTGTGLAADALTLDGGGWGIDSGTQNPAFGVTIGPGGGSFGMTAGTIQINFHGKITGASSGGINFGGPLMLNSPNTAYNAAGGYNLNNTGNDYAGNTTITAGILTNGAAGVIPDTSVVILAGGSWKLQGFNETIKSVSGSSGSITLGGATLTLDNPAGESYSGTILVGSPTGGKVVKNGSGAISLAGGNTFDGGFTLNSGTVGVGGAAVFGTGALTINGGKISDTAAGGRTMTIPLNIAGSFTVDDSLFAGPGQISFNTAAITIATANPTITVNPAGYIFPMGAVVGQDVAGRGFTKAGAGTVSLNNAANTYSGDTTITAGAINIDADGSLGNGAGTLHLSGGSLNITANRTATVSNPIDVTADSAITTTSAAATVDLDLTTSTITPGASTTLTIRNDAASGTGIFQPRLSGSGFNYGEKIAVVNGSFGTTKLQSYNTTGTDQTFSGIISGSGSYTRNASSVGTGGRTIFTAANTYAGGTVVNRGTLLVDNTTGSGTGTGSVTVNSDGTLGGTGTISGTITVASGGNIGAGASAGKLTVGNGLDLSAGGINVWELAANSDSNPGIDYDQIVLTGGNLTLGGSSTLQLRFIGGVVVDGTNPFWQTSHTWTLVSLTGGAANPGLSKFTTITGTNGITAGTFAVITDGTGNVALTYSPNPPTITCAPDKTVDCASQWTFDPPTASPNCGGAPPTVTLQSTSTNGSCPQIITATWQAFDACGLVSTCTQTVTVVDTTPPVVNCPTNKTVTCGSIWRFDTPTATDVCCGTNVFVDAVTTTTNGQCPQLITQNWLIHDCCGNQTNCAQTVTLIDTNPPVLRGSVCATNVYEAGTFGDNFAGPQPGFPSSGLQTRLATAGVTLKGFDDCTVNAFVAHTFTNLGQCITAAKLTVHLKACGNICANDTINLSFTDSGGNLVGNSWTRYLGAGNPQPGLVSDNWCNHTTGDVFTFDLSALPLATSGTVDLLPDLNANGFIDFIVQDDSAVDYAILEVVSCCCPPDKVVPCGSTWAFDDPIATDDCCTNVTLTSTTVTNNATCPQSITRTWLATDCCGNTNTCSQTVMVINPAPIQLLCGQDKQVECGSSWDFDAPIPQPDCCMTITVLGDTTNTIPGAICGLEITRTWQAVDCCSNTAICSQKVIEFDSAPPVLVCATNKTAECDSPWTFDDPTASDLCCGTNVTILVVGTVTNGNAAFPCAQDITRTWEARDCCGNHTNCSQTVTVIDSTPPTINCGQNENLECGLGWDFTVPIIHDNCDPNPVLTIVSTTTNNATCPGSFTATRVWMVSDHCGNSTTCTQIVNSIDQTPPVITCATNKTVDCGVAWEFDPPTAYDGCCGTNVTITIFGTLTNGVCPQQITRRWLARDCCGNTATCNQTVTIVDTTPPVFTCATNKTVDCGSQWTFDTPTAVDVCCGTNVTVILLNTITNVNADGTPSGPCSQVITATWEATDCCSNSITCSQIVTVADITPPVLTCATNKTVECGNPWTFDAPTALDACCGTNITVTLLNTITNVNADGTPSGPCSQVITATWEATDCCSNSITCAQTVTVADTVAPVITCATNKTVECGSPWTFDPPTALDACCGTNITISLLNIVTNLNADGTPSSPCDQVITATWQATDCCDNSTTCSQTVTQMDSTPPVIQCADNKTVECGTAWEFNPPSAYDACCGSNVTITVVNTLTNGTCPQLITRKWLARDCCGNVDTCTQTVTVVDTTPPVFTCLTNHFEAGTTTDDFTGPEPTSPSAGLLVREAGATLKGFDDCTVNAAVVHTFSNLPPCITEARVTMRLKPCGDNCCNDTINLFFTAPSGALVPGSGAWGRALGSGCTTAPGLFADDWCNHAAGEVLVFDLANLPLAGGGFTNLLSDLNANGFLDFSLQDDSAIDYITLDVVSCCCASTNTVECGTDWSFVTPTASDACCDTNVTVTILDTVTNVVPGQICGQEIIRTWVATDCCGNTNICTQTIRVVDTAPPVIQCAPGKGVICGTPWDFDPPIVQDACCGTNVFVTVLNTVTNGQGCELLITRTWEIRDCCGNSTNCSQGIQVSDTDPPVLTCSPGKGVICGTPWDFDPPTAYDDCCGSNITVTVVGTVTNGHGCDLLITRTWEATDCCGNTTNCSQTIQLGDSTPPVLTCAPDKTIECGTDWTFDPPSAYDDCCGSNVTITVLSTVALNTGQGPCLDRFRRIWQATDCCDNSITCTQFVSVVDSTPPTISCTASKTVECSSDWSFDRPATFDACCGTTVTITVLSTVTNGSCPQVITRTWQATDCCSNSATCSQMVTAVDTKPPVFTTHCETNHFEAGTTTDNFVGPEPASPSPALLAREAGATLKGFDNCEVNAAVAHSFVNLPPCITQARVTMRLKPCGDNCCNDSIALFFTAPGGALVPGSGTWSRVLGSGCTASPGLFSDNWCNHVAGEVLVLDLANLPLAGGGFTNLLADLNANGFLDFTLQDDSSIDYITLDVVSCCCANDKVVECGSDWSFETPTATDDCCTNVVITVLSTVTNINPAIQCSLDITRTWLATDCCGNTNTCSETVRVVDTEPPVITCAPGKGVICGTDWSFDPPTAFDRCCGSNVTIVELGTVTNGHGCDLLITRTWMAIDCCDNTSTCSQSIQVGDSDPPVLTCAGDKTVECNSAIIFDPPTAYDLCCGTNVTITVLSTVALNTGQGPCRDAYQRVWQATDCCGNSITCTQTVYTADTTPPVFTCTTNHYEAGTTTDNFVGPEPASPSAALLAREAAATLKGFDNCEVNAAVAHTFANLPPCITEARVTMHLKPCGDNCCNDSIALFFTAPGGALVPGSGTWSRPLGSGCSTQPGLFADDWCNHAAGEVLVFDLSALPLPSGTTNLLADLNANGFLDFTLQDDSAIDYITLDVVSCCCASTNTVECGSEWTLTPPKATDFCCGDNVTVTLLNSVTNTIPGQICGQEILVTWLATDCCGNTNTCTQTIRVVDTAPPTIQCAADKTVECDGQWGFDAPTAFDRCCGTNVTITVLNSVTNSDPTVPCRTIITRTWEATDCCGNKAECSQTVTVVDTTPPVVQCSPGKGVICGTPWDFDPPSASDNCCVEMPTITVVGTVTNGHGCDLLITRTWLITDCCGNSTNCSQTIQLGDSTPPNITCAPGKKVPCDSNWSFDAPTAYDDCCGTNVTISIVSTVTNGICPQTITRTWVAVDCCGNNITCSQTVVLQPCVPPPSGYTLWLPLDETSGTTSTNLYPGGNNGTHVNGPTPTTGYVANSLCFDGVSQYVAVPDYADINPGTGDLSIDAWVKRSSASGTTVRVIVDKRDPNTGVGYSLSVSFGNLVFQMADSSGFTNFRDNLGIVPADDAWHFVAVTLNRASTTGGQFYIDGVATDSFDPTSNSGSLDNTTAFLVGASAITSGNSPWLGCIDEVEFFRRVLAPSEVQAIFGAGASGKCKQPLLVCSPNKVVECGSTWTFDPPQINAPCCGTNVTLVVLNTVTNRDPGSFRCYNTEIVRTWEVTDCCGNKATCRQIVAVVDTTPPVITCATNKTVLCGTAWTFDAPTAYDACAPGTFPEPCTNANVTITVLSTVTNGVCPQIITRTWQASDCCPNSSTCTQTVTVVDNTPPQITCATNKTVLCGTAWTFDPPTALDSCCGTNVTISVVGTVTNFNGCTKIITRTWRARDCCGNFSIECNQTVTENKPPCGPVVITSITYSGGNVTISFPTQPCLIYDVEYKNNLGIFTPWLPLTTVNGTGGVVTVVDPVGPGHKFYRVVCRCQ